MAKKSFSKLGQGADKLTEDLQSFLISGEESPEKEKEEVKIVTVPPLKDEISQNVIKEKSPKIPEIVVKQEEEKPETKPIKTAPTKKEKVGIQKKEYEIPDDFKSHSILFSEKQLSLIQEKVLLEKLHSNRKYTMKLALHEAFSLWLDQKTITPVEYPDDFKTYSALISESQFEKVLNKVYMHKARVDRNYSLKKALFEAIEMFLNS